MYVTSFVVVFHAKYLSTPAGAPVPRSSPIIGSTYKLAVVGFKATPEALITIEFATCPICPAKVPIATAFEP